ncbi:MAG: hypothetical protein L0Z62_48865 [Gemmataceae bacterium]|nr:hypothetical protein [Gemmataceae bacterium]
MKLFNTLFGRRTRRPLTGVRLTVEALEARAVPAVGKWFPAPSLSVDPNVPAAKELTAEVVGIISVGLTR